MRIHRRAWILVLASWLLPPATSASEAAMGELLHVDYVEASTASRWDLPGWAERRGSAGVEIHLHAIYDFDKTPAIQEILAEKVPGPRLVILQECSVYFPGDLEAYQAQFAGWVDRLETAGLRVAVATTVPPAADRGAVHALKTFVKTRLLGHPRQTTQVWAFNDWLRGFASSRGLPLLDLERLLRDSPDNRHLDPGFDGGDGIHVNPAAYALLDASLESFLETVQSAPPATEPESR
jgi:hypothetical protein